MKGEDLAKEFLYPTELHAYEIAACLGLALTEMQKLGVNSADKTLQIVMGCLYTALERKRLTGQIEKPVSDDIKLQ